MSELTKVLKPTYMPVAIYRSKDFPAGASKPSDSHCIFESMFLPALKDGKTVASASGTIGCAGALNGLGFGGEPKEARDRLMVNYSVGSEGYEGRGFFADPDTAEKNYRSKVPVYGDDGDYIVMQPLDEAEAAGAPIETVVFLSNPTEIAALVTLAGYSRGFGCSVIRSSFALSCEQIYAMARQENESAQPRMVLGGTEFHVRGLIDEDKMTISIPYKLYTIMDRDAPKSFLRDDRWRKASAHKKCDDCCC